MGRAHRVCAHLAIRRADSPDRFADELLDFARRCRTSIGRASFSARVRVKRVSASVRGSLAPSSSAFTASVRNRSRVQRQDGQREMDSGRRGCPDRRRAPHGKSSVHLLRSRRKACARAASPRGARFPSASRQGRRAPKRSPDRVRAPCRWRRGRFSARPSACASKALIKAAVKSDRDGELDVAFGQSWGRVRWPPLPSARRGEGNRGRHRRRA